MATNMFVEIDLEEARALAAYTGIEADLRAAREFAGMLIEEQAKPAQNGMLIDALMTATLIRYVRAFGGSRRHPHAIEVTAILTQEQLAVHAEVRNIRSYHIAHASNEMEENRPRARYWIERVREEGISSIDCEHIRMISLDVASLRVLIELMSILLRHVEARIAEERAKVLDIVRGMQPDDPRLFSRGAAV